MYFINTAKTYIKRFDMGKFLEYSEGTYDILTSYFLLKLPGLTESGKYTVTVEENRMDLISYNIYGDTQYWWIIMIYNQEIEVDAVVAGDVLSYPSLTDLENLFFSLAALQNTT
jgi:hypothetical protein